MPTTASYSPAASYSALLALKARCDRHFGMESILEDDRAALNVNFFLYRSPAGVRLFEVTVSMDPAKGWQVSSLAHLTSLRNLYADAC